MFFFRTVSVIPRLPENITRLHELAYNLWFSWNPGAQNLYKKINGDLWEETGHNPVKFLLNVRQEELDRASNDLQYLELYNRVINNFDSYLQSTTWFARSCPEYANQTIAYFSAEFGVHESHLTYSGGLGLLAGDHFKSASDLGVPLVGVGLLYKSGYFTQRINREGWQEAFYPYLNFYEVPVTPAAYNGNKEIIIQVDLAGRPVYLKIWQMRIGRINIYFLDADITQNKPEDRLLTAQLYGGNQETRISQEILLGMGGVKALRSLGIKPGAWHMNEGHAAFLLIERLHELRETGLPKETALEAVKANTLFTCHTPVPAGHDVFSAELMEKYFGHLYETLGMERETLLNLGWDDKFKGFNMSILALRLSSFCNGVSKIHGRVTSEMFHYLYGQIPSEEVPITSITNGVHVENWLAEEIRDLFDTYLGSDWNKNITEKDLWKKVDFIPDEKLWNVHLSLKEKLIQAARQNIKKQRLRNQEPTLRLQEVQHYLRPEIFTIGFARRFATYKRANLLLKDRERLTRLLTNPEHPVQILFAGKAHPVDRSGQELIKQIYDLSNEEPFRGKIAFLEDYDITLARHLLQGVDLWLNNPRQHMEASGTSGQKAAVNGVVNCSIIDGWWPEAYTEDNGFVIGGERRYTDDEIQDLDDAYSLFTLLEETILPLYYQRNGDSIPKKWLQLMKRSLQTIPYYFNTERMIKEYVEKFYNPAIQRNIVASENDFALAHEVANFKERLAKEWAAVKIISIETEAKKMMKVGELLEIQATVRLGAVKPAEIVVEIVYGNMGDRGLYNIHHVPLSPAEQTDQQTYLFKGNLAMPQGTFSYNVRVRPHHKFFTHPFELPLVTWAQNF